MSAQAATRLQGLYDILPPPILKEHDWSLSVLLACLSITIVIALFAWYRWHNTTVQRNRRQFRKLGNKLDKISSAEAGEILHRILLSHLDLPHLNYQGDRVIQIGISQNDWQNLVGMIYRARFSKKCSVSLKPAMQLAQQILWKQS